MCAEYVHAHPTELPMGCESFFIFRTILQAFISHLKCISQGNDSALMFTQMFSERKELKNFPEENMMMIK